MIITDKNEILRRMKTGSKLCHRMDLGGQIIHLDGEENPLIKDNVEMGTVKELMLEGKLCLGIMVGGELLFDLREGIK